MERGMGGGTLTKRTETVEDWFFKANHLGCVRVDMERVVVAAQPIDLPHKAGD